jgi:hypothetical protein
MGEVRYTLFFFWGKGIISMLIQYLDVYIAWLWSMFPTFRKYIHVLPPPSESKWKYLYVCVFSGYAIWTWTVLLFDPTEDSMYVRNVGKIALIYTV